MTSVPGSKIVRNATSIASLAPIVTMVSFSGE
ncbi:Uncharacterised protein [Streptococcus pneumoniae]|nr:Uncharacterised protein [Streptococcus pneumoniae]CKH33530.1 Uncharacterised protein [Streptococcus pneumoniae]